MQSLLTLRLPVCRTHGDRSCHATYYSSANIVCKIQGLTADTHALDTALKLVTRTLDITDDPTQSPYTFRSVFLGLGLSTFGAVLAEIFYFKPQTVTVNSIFLIILAYCLGEATTVIPRAGPIGRFLNPGPFNRKSYPFVYKFCALRDVAIAKDR